MFDRQLREFWSAAVELVKGQRRLPSLMLALFIVGSMTLSPLGTPIAEAAPPFVDLQMSQAGPATVLHGKPFRITATMVNAGNVATPNGQKAAFIGSVPHGFKIVDIKPNNSAFKCEFKNDVQIAIEPTWALYACGSERPMAAGASVIALVTVVAPAQAGAYRLEADADPQNWIVESNELNNESQLPITIS
jgi:hypothetical protein